MVDQSPPHSPYQEQMLQEAGAPPPAPRGANGNAPPPNAPQGANFVGTVLFADEQSPVRNHVANTHDATKVSRELFGSDSG